MFKDDREFVAALGEQLKEERISQNISLTEAAVHLEVSPEEMASIEEGTLTEVPFSTLLELCDYYRIDLFELISKTRISLESL